MTDDVILARARWFETRSKSDEVALLRACLRSHKIERWRLDLAAHCGHDAAATVTGAPPPPTAPERWLRALGPFGEEVGLAATFAAVVKNHDHTAGATTRWVTGELRPWGALLIQFDTPSAKIAEGLETFGREDTEFCVLGGVGTTRTISPTPPFRALGQVVNVVAANTPKDAERWATWPRPFDEGAPPADLRSHLAPLLTAWALRPARGPAKVPGDLDLLVESERWWQGPHWSTWSGGGGR